ncbi:MAG: hypothetical protein A2015_13900 [Spirochaetes bacterium GWF1_31_7]|nr:MAG: hypothetical protein A2Y30_10925 [Spirochaetes bacterium GWE1_32_154]OHD49911.1 MAG: hypothetical protein A2015_13900 [Spirochaetes bacterium GWF1_31_7]OHD74386.1 MAG: hypothetical protein A2355_01900 [Spirochaetes bacterium RIFOXYB1_FULL_32_8]HBD96551.1 hypothetical protein [Spirochaetia bacterium]HBI37715.1 hypothetical protein [Spirochaetia bacterium]
MKRSLIAALVIVYSLATLFYFFYVERIIYNDYLLHEEDTIEAYTRSISNVLAGQIDDVISDFNFLSQTYTSDTAVDIVNQLNPFLYDVSLTNTEPVGEEDVFFLGEYKNARISAFFNGEYTGLQLTADTSVSPGYTFISAFVKLTETAGFYSSLTDTGSFERVVLVTDRDGRILYNSNGVADFSMISDAIKNAVLSYKGNIIEILIAGSPYYLSSAFVSPGDLIVIVYLPKHVLNRHIHSFLFKITSAVSVFFLILLIISILFVIRFIKPVELLTKHLESFSKDGIALKITGNFKGKNAEAVSAFNKMIDERSSFEKEILEAAEYERTRIGIELHDDIGQILTGANFYLMDIQSKDHVITSRDIDGLHELINQALHKVRITARGLYPVIVNENGLIGLIENFIDGFGMHSGIEFNFAHGVSVPVRDEFILFNIFRIIQEAVTNAIKHSECTLISIRLDADESVLKVSICDNGLGINNFTGDGIGLRSMKYRAGLMNAIFSISENTPGTCITLIIRRNENE